jgi:hypothetical protein
LREQLTERGFPLAAVWLNRAFRALPPLEERVLSALQYAVPTELLESADAWKTAIFGHLQELHREQASQTQELQGFLDPLSASCRAWGFPRMARDICDVSGLARLFAACQAFR